MACGWKKNWTLVRGVVERWEKVKIGFETLGGGSESVKLEVGGGRA